MVDFTTTGIAIILFTQLITVADSLVKRLESSKCCGVETEFKKGVTTNNTTNNYYGDAKSSEEE